MREWNYFTVAPLLSWHVKQNHEHELSEGDFYGIIGSMLSLGVISLFDSVKIMHIYTQVELQKNTSDPNVLREAMSDGVDGNIYKDWTYRLAARHNRQVVNLIYEHGEDGSRVEFENRHVFHL